MVWKNERVLAAEAGMESEISGIKNEKFKNEEPACRQAG
jgi:hypothetical protein